MGSFFTTTDHCGRFINFKIFYPNFLPILGIKVGYNQLMINSKLDKWGTNLKRFLLQCSAFACDYSVQSKNIFS